MHFPIDDGTRNKQQTYLNTEIMEGRPKFKSHSKNQRLGMEQNLTGGSEGDFVRGRMT